MRAAPPDGLGRPAFYLLAGPNGAGKSTLYRASVAQCLIPPEAPFVNADLFEAANLQHISDARQRSVLAREWADAQRADCLRRGSPFASETVFSHPSKLALMAQAQEAGFDVVLLVVCVDDPQLLLSRVAGRVAEGGHDVPPERILARYPRTLANLAKAVRLADLALLYDTTAMRPAALAPHRLVARCRGGEIRWQNDPLPRWAHSVLQPAH